VILLVHAESARLEIKDRISNESLTDNSDFPVRIINSRKQIKKDFLLFLLIYQGSERLTQVI
jgi:hypothetical protein